MATVMPKTLHALHHTHETGVIIIYIRLLHPRVNINNRKYTINMDERWECATLKKIHLHFPEAVRIVFEKILSTTNVRASIIIHTTHISIWHLIYVPFSCHMKCLCHIIWKSLDKSNEKSWSRISFTLDETRIMWMHANISAYSYGTIYSLSKRTPFILVFRWER